MTVAPAAALIEVASAERISGLCHATENQWVENPEMGQDCDREGKPAIIRRHVVLPEPDGPRNEKNSPS